MGGTNIQIIAWAKSYSSLKGIANNYDVLTLQVAWLYFIHWKNKGFREIGVSILDFEKQILNVWKTKCLF